MNIPQIIIIGNTLNGDIAKSLINSKYVNVIGGIVDKYAKEEADIQKKFLAENNIKEISFEDINKINPDICIMIAYTRKIDTSYFKKTRLLNIHAGCLPKWRGFNANAWAIINNEKKVAYTLHEANEIIDGGDIYYQFVVPVEQNQKYGELIPKLREGMSKNLPKILYKIHNNKIKPISQNNRPFVYTHKFRKEDGIITDWNVKSNYIYNLFRVMRYPFGSGLFFTHKENKYEILDMELVKNVPDYIAIAGTIVNISANNMWVKTSDNVIQINKISSVEDCGCEMSLQNLFRMGQRLK